MSTAGSGSDDDTRPTDIFPDIPSLRTDILASATAIGVGTVSFVVLVVSLTSFPVFPASLAAYATNVTLPVWGCLLVSSALGVGLSTSYWYSFRQGPIARDYLGPPHLAFVTLFSGTLALVAVVGFLRLLLWLALAFLFLLLILVVPLFFLASLIGASGEDLGVSLVLLVFLIILGFTIGQLDPMALGISLISVLTLILPATAGLIVRNDLADQDIDAFAEYVHKLDTEIRQLDYRLLTRHGLTPYRRAATDPDTVDESVGYVYVPQFDVDTVEAMLVYYQALGRFEPRLASIAAETGGPTGSPSLT